MRETPAWLREVRERADVCDREFSRWARMKVKLLVSDDARRLADLCEMALRQLKSVEWEAGYFEDECPECGGRAKVVQSPMKNGLPEKIRRLLEQKGFFSSSSSERLKQHKDVLRELRLLERDNDQEAFEALSFVHGPVCDLAATIKALETGELPNAKRPPG